MRLIGWGALAGISILMLTSFRSLRPLLLTAFSVSVGILAATVGSIALYGELHLITLVFGASLIGEAADYAIQYFAAQLGSGSSWEPLRGLRTLFPALVLALLTSLLGYSALFLSPFPGVSQVALFSLTGLVASFLTVVLLLPALTRRPLPDSTQSLLAVPTRLLAWWKAKASERVWRRIALGLVGLSLPGWALLSTEDDVRLLVSPPDTLRQQEAEIRRLTGVNTSSQFFLVEGDSPQQVLEREEALVERLGKLQRAGRLASVQAVSAFVPSLSRQADNHRRLERSLLASPGWLREVLDAQGFRDDAVMALVAGFSVAGERSSLEPGEWLQWSLSAPFRHLWMGLTSRGHGSLVLPGGFDSLADLRKAAVGLPGVSLVDKAGSVSEQFRHYRELAFLGMLVAIAVVYLVLGARYGWRNGFVVLQPSLLAMSMALAFCGYAGVPITLFNIMALMLVLGVGVNYALFLHEGGERAGSALVGVGLSGAATLLSFGLLALSSTPALQRFGVTLVIGIAVAMLLAPSVLVQQRPGRP